MTLGPEDSVSYLALEGFPWHNLTVPKPQRRTKAASVKMTESDLEVLNRAAEQLWPGALMTLSSKILSLALRAAEAVLEKPEWGKRPKG